MDDDPWMVDFEKREAVGPYGQSPTDEVAWADDVSSDGFAISFIDQIVRGISPVRVSMPMEIYVEGSRPQVHPLRPGQRCRNPSKPQRNRKGVETEKGKRVNCESHVRDTSGVSGLGCPRNAT